MERALIGAGAVLQIVNFQLLIWKLQAGQRSQAMYLALGAVLLALLTLVAYRRYAPAGR
ncbi:MAG TPA: hypothetical protein VD902_19415 [Symbiobacteriaceae bacterium]|nr:hypothetical protein [Symbiobacteriaceae bacterium]